MMVIFIPAVICDLKCRGRSESKVALSQVVLKKKRNKTIRLLEILTSCFVQSIDYSCDAMLDDLRVVSFPENIGYLIN